MGFALPAFGEFVEFVDEEIAKQKTEKGEDSKNGVFIEPAAGFGQSYSTEGGSPNLSYNLGCEVGYLAQTTSWRRLEAGGEFFMGRVAYQLSSDNKDKVNMVIPTGILAKLGYGYSLGTNLYGVWKLGVGPVMADYKTEGSQYDVEAKDKMWGFAGQIALLLVMPMTDSLFITTGIKWTYYSFDLSDVKVTYANGSPTGAVHAGKPINLNVPEARIGLRLFI